MNPNIFFSNFSGASGISRQNPGISRQNSLIPWVSRDIPNFLAPIPSRGRPPPHQKISGLKSLGLGSLFVPERKQVLLTLTPSSSPPTSKVWGGVPTTPDANNSAKAPQYKREPHRWESAKLSHKRVFALLTPEIHSCEMAQMLQKPVFALPGCQRMSVNTLLCDTLALAEDS